MTRFLIGRRPAPGTPMAAVYIIRLGLKVFCVAAAFGIAAAALYFLYVSDDPYWRSFGFLPERTPFSTDVLMEVIRPVAVGGAVLLLLSLYLLVKGLRALVIALGPG